MREPMKHETLAALGWLDTGNRDGVRSKGFVHKEHKIMDNWKETERYDMVVPNNYRIKDFSRAPKSGLTAKPNEFGRGIDSDHEQHDDFIKGMFK